tara:strand:- start:228 stop:353 length:126 start_codon:yes stop_codon:yes gene_type:complete
MSTKENYKDLAFSSFDEYNNRLNWIMAGEKVKTLLHNFVYI